MKEPQACEWAQKDPLMLQYHNTEWGVPLHDDRALFEFLILEGFQAGLSWRTILYKRENFRKAFDKFDFAKIARYDDRKVKTLLADAGIIRNRLKILGAVSNAQAFIKVREEFGTFDKYMWSFVKSKPLQPRRKNMKDIPSQTAISDAFSADLKKRGFKFVGSTVVYAHMQATGMINDHVTSCPRHKDLS